MLLSTFKRLLGLSRAEPAYWWAIDAWWETSDIYGSAEEFERTFALAPEYAQNVFAAHWATSEVINGALPQFFYNPAGVLAPEAKNALRVVGLEGSARALERAMLVFGNQYPKDRDSRASRMAPLFERVRSAPDRALLDHLLELSEEFLDGLGKNCKDLEPTLSAYAERFRSSVLP